MMPTTSTTPADERDPATAPAWLTWLCPLTTAVLLYLCYFPVALGPLAWIALVPFLLLARLPGRPKRLYLSCWLASLAFHWAILQWVRVADWMMYIAWGLLATYGSFYWPVGLALLRWLTRRTALPLTLTAPAVWVCLEYVRYGMLGCFYSLVTGNHQHDVPGGFAWYLIGHTQHDFLEMIQIADVVGAFGVTALVVAVNALVVEILCARAWFRRRLLGSEAEPTAGKVSLLIQGIAVTVLLLLAMGYGLWRLSEPVDYHGPKLALMQTSLDQRRRNLAGGGDGDDREEARRSVRDEFGTLAVIAAHYKPDLIVTPETSYPGIWVEYYPGRPSKECQERADEMAAKLKAPVLLGMGAFEQDEQGDKRSYNSSILVGRDGKWQGRYDKIHRVPFGEYIPLRTTLPFLSAFAPYDYEYVVAPGKKFTQFPLSGPDRTYTFGVVICYEDTDPAMARPYGGGGRAQTDFVLNVSNDGWFDGTSEHDQHLAICRFRAIEGRRGVARSVNMGISAVIDPNGRVLAPQLLLARQGIHIWQIPEGKSSLPVSRWHEFKKVSGVLLGRVPIDTRGTVYARYGDWFAGSCLGIVALGCLTLTVRRKRDE